MNLFPEFKKQYGSWGVVAGASEGLGSAYAHALAERGLNVLTIARRTPALERDAQLIRDRYGVQVQTLALDLTAADMPEIFAKAIDGLDIGILICNAGLWVISEFMQTTAQDHQRMLDLNCRSLISLLHPMAQRFKKQERGGIVIMSSLSGMQGNALLSSYAATKAFDTVLAEGLWAELKPYGVDVLACVAGAMATPGFYQVTPQAKQASAFPAYPGEVARRTLDALQNKKQQPLFIPAAGPRFANAMGRFLTRKLRVRFFSHMNRKLYGDAVTTRKQNT